MKHFSVKAMMQYVYNHFLGNFAGFVIGMAATKLVAHFFVTRSIKNLWGLAAKKTVVDKSTYSNLQLVISIVIGFIVFEVIAKLVKEKTAQWRGMPKEEVAV